MSLHTDEQYIKRCFFLALKGKGRVKANPLVGAVIVHNDRIIGEGYHKIYGQAHAEVNAVASVRVADRHLLPSSTIYVSLEPCCIYGKTPPCSNLIIDKQFKRVVVSCRDFTPEVWGKGIQQIKDAGIDVTENVLNQAGEALSYPRKIYVTKQRPYIILKYAQSKDGFIGGLGDEQIWISNGLSKRLVHKWRSECNAIMIGTRTSIVDNPNLTTRHYFGNSPLRIVIDKENKLPLSLHLFNNEAPSLIINQHYNKTVDTNTWLKLPFEDEQLLPSLLKHLHQERVGTLLVEGGAKLLSSFIEQNLWDEARVITSDKQLFKGVKSPLIPTFAKDRKQLDDNTVEWFFNQDK